MSYRDLRPVLDGLPPGPFRSDEAPGLGLSRRSVTRYPAAGALRRPLRGVLVRADLPDCFELRAEAVRLALPPHAVLCRGAAAWLYGIDPRPRGRQLTPVPLECYVPVGRQPPRRAGVRCYVTDVDPRDVVEVGVATCTSPERTAVDLARGLSPGMGLAVRLSWEYDGREFHDGPAARRHDERRRARIRRECGWTVWGVDLGDVLGRSMHLEHAVGDALGIEPRISRRPC